MKVYFHQFTDKVGDKWAFSFAILPDVEFYWLGGLKPWTPSKRILEKLKIELTIKIK